MTTTITSKGQVTIPLEYLEHYGFLPDTAVEFVSDKDGLHLIKASSNKGRGQKIAEHLRGRGNRKWTTDQLMKLMRGENGGAG